MTDQITNDVPDESLYSSRFITNLNSSIRFELLSGFGRALFTRKPPIVGIHQNLLHLGCGTNLLNGWVNADFFHGRFWSTPRSFWALDLRYPLHCDSNYWDGIFSEHTFEHLYPLQVRNLLRELLRTLKPTCWLRISVPDLRKYIDFYSKRPVDKEFLKWTTGAEAVRSLTQNWGHLSVWDGELLKRTVSEVGFVNVRTVGFMEGTDERLCKESASRCWESLYLEAQKP
jgi:hypothetical protein